MFGMFFDNLNENSIAFFPTGNFLKIDGSNNNIRLQSMSDLHVGSKL